MFSIFVSACFRNASFIFFFSRATFIDFIWHRNSKQKNTIHVTLISYMILFTGIKLNMNFFLIFKHANIYSQKGDLAVINVKPSQMRCFYHVHVIFRIMIRMKGHLICFHAHVNYKGM